MQFASGVFVLLGSVSSNADHSPRTPILIYTPSASETCPRFIPLPTHLYYNNHGDSPWIDARVQPVETS
jgi:hypothetical protein